MTENMNEDNNNSASLGLSTELANPVLYIAKETPKGVKIKIGNTYKIINGYGEKEATITGIRKLDGEVIIYYKTPADNSKGWATNYSEHSCGLEVFKAQLMDYGRMDEIELLYPSNNN